MRRISLSTSGFFIGITGRLTRLPCAINEEDDANDVFNGYSDVSDDSDDDETRQLVTTLSFLDADEVPAYNFTKKEVVHVMPVFQPDTVQPGDGNALDFFSYFTTTGFWKGLCGLRTFWLRCDSVWASTRTGHGLRSLWTS